MVYPHQDAQECVEKDPRC
jgi:hypothetical protein